MKAMMAAQIMTQYPFLAQAAPMISPMA